MPLDVKKSPFNELEKYSSNSDLFIFMRFFDLVFYYGLGVVSPSTDDKIEFDISSDKWAYSVLDFIWVVSCLSRFGPNNKQENK